MLDICGNEIDCSLIKSEPKCEEEISEANEIDTNILGRRKRHLQKQDSDNKSKIVRRVASKIQDKQNKATKEKSRTKRKRAKIEMKFRFIGM